MLRKLVLLALALIAIAQPLTANADLLQGPRTCDDIIPPTSFKSRSDDQPADEDEPRCPNDDGTSPRPIIVTPPPPPCVPNPLTGLCKIDD